MLMRALALMSLIGMAMVNARADEAGDPEVAPPSPPSTIYRTTDEHGNIVFTDQPGQGQAAEAVKLKPTNTVPGENTKALQDKLKAPLPQVKERAVSYQSVRITSPEDGASLRNPDKPVPVSVALVPKLQEDDQLVLYDNGVAQPDMTLDAPDRGTHFLKVKVLSKSGDVLISSDAIKVYVHRTSVHNMQSSRNNQNLNDGKAHLGGPAQVGAGAQLGSPAQPGSPAILGTPAKLGTYAKPIMLESARPAN
ncbi:MAG: DUF4124 domain-containing protein [Alcanivorax sp.]|nr:DUF4124 domain-containing protein [Alcanivorax sp.]